MGKYWAYVKRNPVMFLSAFLVFGLLLFLLTRGGGSAASSGGTVIASGPSEAFQAQAMAIGAQNQQAQLAANVQLTTAQIAANAQANAQAIELEALTRQLDSSENLAVMSMQLSLREMENTRAITSEQTQASIQALQSQLQFGLATTEANNQASVDMATIAYDAQITQMALGAQLQRDMLEAQVDMFNSSLEVQKDANILSTIQTAKKKDRDTLLGAFLANRSGQAFSGGKGDDYISIGAPANYNAGYVPNAATV